MHDKPSLRAYYIEYAQWFIGTAVVVGGVATFAWYPELHPESFDPGLSGFKTWLLDWGTIGAIIKSGLTLAAPPFVLCLIGALALAKHKKFEFRLAVAAIASIALTVLVGAVIHLSSSPLTFLAKFDGVWINSERGSAEQKFLVFLSGSERLVAMPLSSEQELAGIDLKLQQVDRERGIVVATSRAGVRSGKPRTFTFTLASGSSGATSRLRINSERLNADVSFLRPTTDFDRRNIVPGAKLFAIHNRAVGACKNAARKMAPTLLFHDDEPYPVMGIAPADVRLIDDTYRVDIMASATGMISDKLFAVRCSVTRDGTVTKVGGCDPKTNSDCYLPVQPLN